MFRSCTVRLMDDIYLDALEISVRPRYRSVVLCSGTVVSVILDDVWTVEVIVKCLVFQVEVKALPLMVDCRPAGAPPHDMAHNGAADNAHQQQQQQQAAPSGDMASHARASTPAAPAYQHPYNGAMPPMGPTGPAGAPYCAPYGCMKSVVWCGPGAHAPPPPPPGVNPHAYKSLQPSGADLPMNDVATLRFYYNAGVDCVWAAYGPPPPPPAPRPYSARDLAHEMAAVSLDHKKDKPPPPKGNPQRPLVGPRFKRNGSQDGGHNKGHGGNAPNKGPNNRRNSHVDGRVQYMGGVGEDCVEPLVPFPYLYPPPLYSVPYYPIESEPAMMGMMGGMGGVGGMGYAPYEEAVEYAPVQTYYPAHFAPPPPHAMGAAPSAALAPHPAHAPLAQHAPLHQEHK